MLTCPSCERRFSEDVRVCPHDGTLTIEEPTGALQGSMTGRVLDRRWKIEGLLQEGGMGSVFRGRQLSVKREVAIKLIRETVVREPVLVARFYRESQVLSDLQHPNIVTMYDFGQDEPSGDLFMVMELLRGESLLAWREGAQLVTLRDILQIAEQLFAALAEVHAKDVVHRDLKPENIFVERLSNGNIHLKLIDFGIAKVNAPHLTRLTAAGHLQGTPYYMAPEQIEGQPCTPQTDLYAAGVLLYEMLAGREPFPGETLMAVLTQHLTKEPDPLEEVWALRDPIHKPLIELVGELMAKKPGDRPKYTLRVWERVKEMSSAMVASLPGGVVSMDTANYRQVRAHDVGLEEDQEETSDFLRMTADPPDGQSVEEHTKSSQKVLAQTDPNPPDAALLEAPKTDGDLGKTFHAWDQPSTQDAFVSGEFSFQSGPTTLQKILALVVGVVLVLGIVGLFLVWDSKDQEGEVGSSPSVSKPLPPPIKPPPTAPSEPTATSDPEPDSQDPKVEPDAKKPVARPSSGGTNRMPVKSTPPPKRTNSKDLEAILNDMRRP